MLLGLLSQCSSKGVQRTSLQHMLAALNDAAEACGPLSAFCAEENERAARAVLIITHLRAVAATLPSFQGASYQLSVSRGASPWRREALPQKQSHHAAKALSGSRRDPARGPGSPGGSACRHRAAGCDAAPGRRL